MGIFNYAMSHSAHVLEQERCNGRRPGAASAPECVRCAEQFISRLSGFALTAAVDSIGELLRDTGVHKSFDVLKVCSKQKSPQISSHHTATHRSTPMGMIVT
jgi:hypothetical protein